MATRHTSRPDRLAQAAIGLLLFVGCNDLPIRGGSDVEVHLGDATVFQRERFVGDRFADIEWLRAQLASPDYEPGLQGKSTTLFRLIRSLAAETAFDPGAGLAIQFDQAAQENAEEPPAGEGGGGGEVDADDSGNPPATTSSLATEDDGDAAGDMGSNGDERGDGDPPVNEGGASEPEDTRTRIVLDLPSALEFSSLGTGSDILEPANDEDIGSTPQDLLRDRLAFRDEVRAAIRQRSLDDTHDLESSTIYDLVFDLTLTPGENAGSSYAVVMTLDETTKKKPRPAFLDQVKQAALRETMTQALISGERAGRQMLTTRDGQVGALATLHGSLVGYFQALEIAWREIQSTFEKHDRLIDDAERLLDATKDGAHAAERARVSRAIDGYRTLGRAKATWKFRESLSPYERDHRGWAAEAMAAHVKVLRANAKGGDSSGSSTKHLIRGVRSRWYAFAALSELAGQAQKEAKSVREASAALLAAISTRNDTEPEPEVESLRVSLSMCCEECEACDDSILLATSQKLMGPLIATPDRKTESLSAVPLDDRTVAAPSRSRSYPGRPAGRPQAPAMPEAPRPDEAASPLFAAVQDALELPWAIAAPYVGQFAQILIADTTAEHFNGVLQVDPFLGLPVDPVANLSMIQLSRKRKADTELKKRIKKQPKHVRIVGVLPEQQVERLSTTAQSQLKRALRLSALGRIDQNTSLGTDFQQLSSELRRYDLIQRNPLIVGFLQGGNTVGNDDDGSSRQRFGWILGPRLETTTEGKAGLRYRHTAQHHSVAVQVVAHAAITSLQFDLKLYEITEKGYWIEHGQAAPVEVLANGAFASGDRRILVSLPGDAEALVHGLLYEKDPATAGPFIAPGDWQVQVGRPATIVIQGQNVWRDPQVFINGQRADEVAILPDLAGLSASFGKIAAPAGSPKKIVTADLIVSTSQGTDVLQDSVVIHPATKEKPKTDAKKNGAALQIKSKALATSVGSGGKAEVDLDFTVGSSFPTTLAALEVEWSRLGALGRLSGDTIDPKNILLDRKAKSLRLVDVPVVVEDGAVILNLSIRGKARLGDDWQRLTASDVRVGIIASSVTGSAQADPQEVRVKYDKAKAGYLLLDPFSLRSNGLSPAAVTTLEELLPELRKTNGAPAELSIGTASLKGRRVKLVTEGNGAAAVTRVVLDLPKDTLIVGLKRNGQGELDPTDPKATFKVNPIEFDLGKVTLRVIQS
jgi:hypothetical protein